MTVCSTDNTQNLVRKYPVKLILNEKKNVAAARNLGVKEAKGEYIAFTDGDCRADKSWLSTLVNEMLNAPENVACIGGPNLIFNTDSLFCPCSRPYPGDFFRIRRLCTVK
ncbi:glycosyltransferase [uncultured Methanomethylovorans sp.]|uniref:glycosyltransferase n=1 Tax=uncultured Methanomethylovorans sp. TaxID=183759 RepID=UPI002AA65203|nr:glycosyltransferase [uncultured Methanomethylovorans sp.]